MIVLPAQRASQPRLPQPRPRLLQRLVQLLPCSATHAHCEHHNHHHSRTRRSGERRTTFSSSTTFSLSTIFFSSSSLRASCAESILWQQAHAHTCADPRCHERRHVVPQARRHHAHTRRATRERADSARGESARRVHVCRRSTGVCHGRCAAHFVSPWGHFLQKSYHVDTKNVSKMLMLHDFTVKMLHCTIVVSSCIIVVTEWYTNVTHWPHSSSGW